LECYEGTASRHEECIGSAEEWMRESEQLWDRLTISTRTVKCEEDDAVEKNDGRIY
jgi:hypothetical protein